MTRTHIWVTTAAICLFAHAAAAQTASITLADARKALTGAEQAATKMNANLSCAIVDARGDLVASERMDRARYFTSNVAVGKARASATFGQPSGGLTNIGALRVDAAFDTPMLFIQGAVPIVRNNQPVGAIGCSGGSGQQDEDAAKAGVAAMQ